MGLSVSLQCPVTGWGWHVGNLASKQMQGWTPRDSSWVISHYACCIRKSGQCIFVVKHWYICGWFWMSRKEENKKIRKFLAGGLVSLLSKKHRGLVWLEWEKRTELGKGFAWWRFNRKRKKINNFVPHEVSLRMKTVMNCVYSGTNKA